MNEKVSNEAENPALNKGAVMRIHLRFSMMEAGINCKENRHPQVVMKELGITYQHATPQSMGDQWWFWNCENLPEKMPSYLTPLNSYKDNKQLDPMECIGYGLSKEDAKSIRDYA